MQSEVEVNPTFSEDTISDNPLFEDLREGDPVTPSNIDINDYLHIEEVKWEVHGNYFDKIPNYDTDDADINRSLVSLHNPRVVVELHVDPFLNPSCNKESFLLPEYDHHEQSTCYVSPCHQSPFPSNHDLRMAIKHNMNDRGKGRG